MKATNKALIFLLSITMIITLIGCSAKNDTIDIDISYLSNKLLENVEFEDDLNAADDNTVKKLYNINNYVNASVYIGSGATAEEIAVFEFDSKKAAQDGMKMAQNRIEEQKADFESYIPKEVQKLNNAVVKQLGKYVIVCVSNSSEAEKIITQYISEKNEE